jgi:hypothetical protein
MIRVRMKQTGAPMACDGKLAEFLSNKEAHLAFSHNHPEPGGASEYRSAAHASNLH